MAKGKAHPNQLGFLFEAPIARTGVAALAGIERRISATVATILNTDSRQREVIAAEMSVLLDEDVSRLMLDAYASPARTEHKVPMSRFLALVQVTGRHDLMDPLFREIGAAVLVGEEVLTARVGHVRQQIRELQAEMRRLEGSAPLIRAGGTDGK